jgi:predicted nucleotidyltransferase
VSHVATPSRPPRDRAVVEASSIYRRIMTSGNETPVPPSRRAEVVRLLELIQRWAVGRTDLRAVALVGSWARDDPRSDSDVDLLLLTDNPAAYLDEEQWAEALGAMAFVRTQQWGVVTERRVALASGLEIEFGVTSPAWASTGPLDAGTQQAALDGLVVLHDPDQLLATVLTAVAPQTS